MATQTHKNHFLVVTEKRILWCPNTYHDSKTSQSFAFYHNTNLKILPPKIAQKVARTFFQKEHLAKIATFDFFSLFLSEKTLTIIRLIDHPNGPEPFVASYKTIPTHSEKKYL